jgi:hypothetical protein
MVLRIDKQALGRRVILQLVGAVSTEHLDEVRAQIKAAGRDIVVDVGAVTLISVEGIRFLNSCENQGITITNASPYIAEWMTLERRCE